MTTADDITRLADEVLNLHAPGNPTPDDYARRKRIAAELRILALQQGKAGGVADIPAGTLVSVDVSTGDDDFDHRIFATVTGVQRDRPEKPVILCEEQSRNFAPPAHSSDAGDADAWMHEDDPTRVISAKTKSGALADSGASGSSVRPYSIALRRLAPQPKDAR